MHSLDSDYLNNSVSDSDRADFTVMPMQNGNADAKMVRLTSRFRSKQEI